MVLVGPLTSDTRPSVTLTGGGRAVTELSGYSAWIDLGQVSSPTATPRRRHGRRWSRPMKIRQPTRRLHRHAALVRQVSSWVERVTAREGSRALGSRSHVAEGSPRRIEHLAAEVAQHLGLRPDRVLLVDTAEMATLGRSHALDAPTIAVAVGAALAAPRSDPPAIDGMLAAGAGGALPEALVGHCSAASRPQLAQQARLVRRDAGPHLVYRSGRPQASVQQESRSAQEQPSVPSAYRWDPVPSSGRQAYPWP